MIINKRFLQLAAFSVVISLTACGGGNQQKANKQSGMPAEHGAMSNQPSPEDTGDMHKQHNNLTENFAHKNIRILDKVYPVNEQTQAELEGVIDAYLHMQDALANDDVDATDKAIGLMLNKIYAVKPDNLDGEGLDAWKDHMGLYENKLKEMQHIKGLEDKRSYFSHISEIMYCTIKSFGLKQGNLFAVFCPMAFDNKGAYWISDSKTIQNPYFGSIMPICGEIKEEL